MISINDELHVAMVETTNHYTFWCKCHIGEAPTAVAFVDGCMLHCTRLASDCYVKQVTGYGYVHVLGPMRDVRLYHYLGCSVIQIYCYQRSGFLQWPPLSVFYHSDARLKDLKKQIMSL